METAYKIFVISLGSALGGNLRFWLGQWIQTKFVAEFPLGTLVVNLSGAFLLGFLSSYWGEKLHDSTLGLFFSVGIVASYTTFSTLELDTFRLANESAYGLALLNILGSAFLGFVALWWGVMMGRG